ncbi:hypothetical protein ACF0H5_022368 [Mactra antiquata]
MGSAVSCSSKGNVKTANSVNTTHNNNSNNNSGDTMFASSSIKPQEADDVTTSDEIVKAKETTDDEKKDLNTEKEKNGDDDVDNDDDNKDDVKKTTVTSEPYTPEELANFKKEKLEELKTKLENALACDPRKEEEGMFVVKIRNAVLKVSQIYFALKRTTEEEIKIFRLDIAKLVVETKFIDLMHEIIEWTFQNGWHDGDTTKQSKKYLPLSHTLLSLQNFTDASEMLAIEIASRSKMLHEVTSKIVQYTDRHLGKVEPILKGTEHKVFGWCVSLVHNLSMVESNVNALREAGLIDIMQPLLKSPFEITSMCALATLAGIINEQECDIINGNKEIVMLLLDMLRKGQKTKAHRYQGWSCKECTYTIRMLARNDANKKLLVDLGALELLVNLGKIGNMEEKYESAEAIWALSFDAENQALITGNAELGVIELLMELKQEDSNKIKKACNGALWNMKEALRCTVIEKYREIGEKLNARHEESDVETDRKKSRKLKKVAGKPSKDETTSDKHIMISYQWSDQAILKDIKDNIKACGFKVWMDIDNMGGSTLESMANAVEDADIVLMCMSSKYKTSLPCRAEAEYAYQTKKTIIPLKMEKGYYPDGWLGFILGTKLFFEFSGKYPFEKKMEELLKAISTERKKVDSTDGGDIVIPSEIKVTHSTPPVSQEKTPVASTTSNIPRGLSYVSMETINTIRKWSADDVKKWIQKNNLDGCKLDHLTGGEVALLINMRFECPEYFYKCLESMLHVRDLLTMSRIVWALNDLNELK